MREHITEEPDGTTTRVVEPDATHTTTIVERRGSGVGTILLIAVLIALGAIAYFLFVAGERETARDDAIGDAATAVEGAAKDVGEAAKKAVE